MSGEKVNLTRLNLPFVEEIMLNTYLIIVQSYHIIMLDYLVNLNLMIE